MDGAFSPLYMTLSPTSVQNFRFSGFQTNFFILLDQDGDTSMFFITEEAKKIVLDFSQGTARVL